MAPPLPGRVVGPEESFVQRVYITVIGMRNPTVHGLNDLLGEGDSLEAALEVLVERGLVTVAPDGRIDVPSPDLAIAAFAASLERQATAARAVARRLTVRFNEARQRPPDELTTFRLRPLEPQELVAAATALMVDATSSIVAMRGLTPVTPDGGSELPVFDLTPGVKRETVVCARVLESAAAFDALQQRLAAGDDVRVHPELPFSALVVDERFVLVHVPGTGGEPELAFQWHNHDLGHAMANLIRLVHGHAKPLPGGRIRDRPDPHLDARDRVLLTLLASGASDSTIAREMGVSPRTVERRLRRILDHLGARSRFQAGVEAHRRKLV